jgi:hypothetical protein
LLGHLEGHDSADTEARQAVRPAGLHFADLSNEMFGDRLDSLQRLPVTLEANGLKHMYGLVGTQKPGKVGECEGVAVRCGNHKQRWPKPLWLQGYKR